MELSSVLRKVRALIAIAEKPVDPSLNAEQAAATKREQEAARAMADELMEKFGVQEWQTMKDSNTGLKPDRIKVDIGEGGTPFLAQTAMLVSIVAEFCRCSSVWIEKSGMYGRPEYCYVYGFQSDLRYFELLFTVVFLHVSDLINPKADPALSRGEAIRELRNGGLNWNEIAEAFGWRLQARDGSRTTYRQKDTGDVETWSKVVGRIKADYAKEIRSRGEEPFTLGRGGAGNSNFRINSINGYLVRLRQRLQEQAGKRGTGTEIILRDKSQNIRTQIEADFPEMRKAVNKSGKFNPEAYARGVRHANTASLSPEAGAAEKSEIS